MASVVEICNLALSHLRIGSINSLEENSVEAQLLTLHFPLVRDQVLKEFDWGFNNKTAPMQLLSGVKIFGWSLAWQYPNDCLRINKLMRQTDDRVEEGYISSRYDVRMLARTPPAIEFRVVNNNGQCIIVTNEYDLYINYRMRVTDPNLYGPDTTIAMSHLLAARIAVSRLGVKDGRPMMNDQLALYQGFLDESKADSVEERQSMERQSEFITIREN